MQLTLVVVNCWQIAGDGGSRGEEEEHYFFEGEAVGNCIK